MKKNNEELVSFIIPVYNVEKYIKKCVESITNQTYKNIEIILVDDGSTDNSSKIIDNLAVECKKINIIHKKNEGVSIARNIGLKHASGKYILFIDADDYVESNYAEYFVNLVSKNECKMAVNYNRFSLYNTRKEKELSSPIKNSEEIVEEIYTRRMNEAVWNKIYDRNFLIDNNIWFDENIWYGEGMLFNIRCLQYLDKVAVGNLDVYHQVFNPESAMRLFNLESNHCGIRSLELQKACWKKTNKKIEDAWTYHRREFNISILLGLARTNQKDKYLTEYKQCKKNLRKNILIPLKVNIPFKRKIYEIFFTFFPNTMIKLTIIREKRKFKAEI